MNTDIIQFQCHHREGAPVWQPDLWDRFCAARERCRAWGIVGHDPARYMGYAFGNLSVRWPNMPAEAFAITGTGTSGYETLSPADCALCERCDLEAHALWSVGGRRPSSESLSHAPFYRHAKSVQAVIHGHCPSVWQNARALELPCTPVEAACGTAALSHALTNLLSTFEEASGIVALLGHEDGIIAFGPTIEDVIARLDQMIARAAQLQ